MLRFVTRVMLGTIFRKVQLVRRAAEMRITRGMRGARAAFERRSMLESGLAKKPRIDVLTCRGRRKRHRKAAVARGTTAKQRMLAQRELYSNTQNDGVFGYCHVKKILKVQECGNGRK